MIPVPADTAGLLPGDGHPGRHDQEAPSPCPSSQNLRKNGPHRHCPASEEDELVERGPHPTGTTRSCMGTRNGMCHPLQRGAISAPCGRVSHGREGHPTWRRATTSSTWPALRKTPRCWSITAKGYGKRTALRASTGSRPATARASSAMMVTDKTGPLAAQLLVQRRGGHPAHHRGRHHHPRAGWRTSASPAATPRACASCALPRAAEVVGRGPLRGRGGRSPRGERRQRERRPAGGGSLRRCRLRPGHGHSRNHRHPRGRAVSPPRRLFRRPMA